MGIMMPPLSAAQIHAKRVGIPPIEAFSGALIGDGVTDDSVAFQAAHDSAVAAGVREVYVSMSHYIPSAWQIGKVLFRGPGSISHTHKRVAPLSAPSGHSFVGRGVSPALHLPRLKAASSPVVVLVGDSRSSLGANFLTPLDRTWDILRRAFRRANPTKLFTFYNYAIAGTTWAQFSSTSTSDPNGTGHAGFTWQAGASWRDQVLALQADVVVFAFGMNGAAAPSSIITSCSHVCSGAKVPDIVFVTPPCPTFDFATATAAEQDQRQRNAGLMRSLSVSGGAAAGAASVPPIGLIDAARLTTRTSRGYDPAVHVPTRVLTNVSGITSFPYALPRCKDIDIKVTFPGQAAPATSPALTLRLDGSQAWNLLIADNGAGGNARGLYALSNGGATLTSTGGATPALPSSGDWWFQFTVKDSWARVETSSGVLFDAPITRYDAEYDMQLHCTRSGANMTVNHLNIGVADLCAPSLTDNDVWGSTLDVPSGGGTGNHEATAGIAIIEKAFAMTDLCAS